ncbi:helix-turn-helix domain-containing protein [Acinetobacter baumannii]
MAKSKKYDKLRLQAKSLYDEKLSKTYIAEKLGVSRRTITRWLEHD